MSKRSLVAAFLSLQLFVAAGVGVAQQPDRSRAIAIAEERCAADQWVLLIEPNHSTVGFSIPIMGGLTKVTGKFTRLDCVICYSDELGASSVKLVIDAASVDTGIDGRDSDLATEKFFDTDRTPLIVFESDSIEMRGNQWVAVGDLTMRGVSKRVELPFVLTGNSKNEAGRPVVGVALNYTFNRQDYGVGSDWVHSAIPGFLGDDVTVDVFMYTRSGRKIDELR